MPHCKALYNHAFFDINAGYKTCCNAKPLKNFSTNDYTFDEFYNSDYVNEVRETMKTGWHPNCSLCKMCEDNGITSNRTLHNYLHHPKTAEGVIDYVNVKFSNKCNLACRMCNTGDSSKWGKILNLSENQKSIPIEIFEQLPLQNVKKIAYIGGETLLTDEMDYILDKCIEYDLTLHITTNATFFPKARLLEKIKKISKLYLVMSIDAFNSVNDYIRQGSDIEVVKKVYDKWHSMPKKNITLSINTVVQAYNIHCIHEIKEIAIRDKMFVDWLPVEGNGYLNQGTKEFKLNALPPAYIDEIRNEHNQIFLKDYAFDPGLFEKLKKTTKHQDQLFKTDIGDYIPRLAYYFA
jgi:molybdenum cofactor biosynthesis enzyme MoaA